MGMLAWIFGFLGGLCMVVGIMTATVVIPPLGEAFTWLFWFWLSAILLLVTIAFAVAGGRGEY